jgi:hypothetical protein
MGSAMKRGNPVEVTELSRLAGTNQRGGRLQCGASLGGMFY